MPTRLTQSAAGMSFDVPPSPAINVDMRGVRVSRGVMVSWHGYRARVVRVCKGRAFIWFAPMSRARRAALPGGALDERWVPYSSLQVVT